MRILLSECTANLIGFVGHEQGQDVVEYGLLIATIAVVVLLVATGFGGQIHLWFNALAGEITTLGT